MVFLAEKQTLLKNKLITIDRWNSSLGLSHPEESGRTEEGEGRGRGEERFRFSSQQKRFHREREGRGRG